MDSKRKASGAHGLDAANDAADRAAKRRKIVEEFDLNKVDETPQSTRAYGLFIVDSVRATTDKSGRSVTGWFEKLPSPIEKPEYYRKIRMPLSLQTITEKLDSYQYPNLSTLESDFKRMVSNCKEIVESRTSEAFLDSERVRKAVSNLMTKFNPAYKSGAYQAFPTPFPGDPIMNEIGGAAPFRAARKPKQPRAPRNSKSAPPKSSLAFASPELAPGPEEDAEGEPDGLEPGDLEPGDLEPGDLEPDGPEPDASGEVDADVGTTMSGLSTAEPSQSIGKSDPGEEDGLFKGLDFQQAQETVIDELIRMRDDDGYPHFDNFIYLPPRSLKDYYDVIKDPVSLKGVQKQVVGRHGRNDATGVSDFKSWAALEEETSKIWKNAYHYNEDGSEIYRQAQELEQTFAKLVDEAKQQGQESLQPKIKLKVAQNTDAASKKIRIVKRPNKAEGTPQPAMQGYQPGNTTVAPIKLTVKQYPSSYADGTPVPPESTPTPSAFMAPRNPQLDNVRSASVARSSPSPATGLSRPEDSAMTNTEGSMSQPGAAAPAIDVIAQEVTSVVATPPVSVAVPVGTAVSATNASSRLATQPQPAPPPRRTLTEILNGAKYRPLPGDTAEDRPSAFLSLQPSRDLENMIQDSGASEAMMPRLVIGTHPDLNVQRRMLINIPASVIEYQQEHIFNAPSTHYRVLVRPFLSPALEDCGREWRLFVTYNQQLLTPNLQLSPTANEPAFELTLSYGVNRLEVCMVAASSFDDPGPHGVQALMERVTVHFNLMRRS